MSIVTRTGDNGETGLFGGQRIAKDDIRMEAIGTVDELNAVIGLVLATSPYPPAPFPREEKGGHDEQGYSLNHQVNGSVLEHARDMRKIPTKAEEILWERLRRDQLSVHFRRQHSVQGFILDFYCDQAKLGIEVDGEIHDDPIKKAEDVYRENKLSDEGIQIIRFKNEEVLNNVESVLDIIRSFIHSPLPSGEGLGEGEVMKEVGGDLGVGETMQEIGGQLREAEIMRSQLLHTQNVLFTLGADLATPHEHNKAIAPRIEQTHIDELEQWIAILEETPLPPYFILPGGSQTAATLHMARAVCRRAERAAVSLSKNVSLGLMIVRYLNRLSDYLFLASLEANKKENVDNIRVSYA